MNSLLKNTLLFTVSCLAALSCSCTKRVNSIPDHSKLTKEISIPLIRNDTLTNQLIVRASVNDQEGLFIVDTGATVCSISKQFAKKLALDLKHSPADQVGSNITSKIEHATIKSLKIGSAAFNNFKIYAVELRHINRFIEDPIDGIIGITLLSQLSAITIDYKKQFLTLNTQKKHGYTAPMNIKDYQLFTDIFITGGSIKMKIDTGASDTTVDAKTWETLKGSGSIQERERTISDINGTIKKTSELISINNLTLGELRVSHLTVGSDKLNLLGMNLFKHYSVTFAFDENKMYFQSNGDTPK